jgi:hypothetical protein
MSQKDGGFLPSIHAIVGNQVCNSFRHISDCPDLYRKVKHQNSPNHTQDPSADQGKSSPILTLNSCSIPVNFPSVMSMPKDSILCIALYFPDEAAFGFGD